MAQLLRAETSGGFCRHKKVPDSEVLTKKAAEWDPMLRSLFLTLLIRRGLVLLRQLLPGFGNVPFNFCGGQLHATAEHANVHALEHLIRASGIRV